MSKDILGRPEGSVNVELEFDQILKENERFDKEHHRRVGLKELTEDKDKDKAKDKAVDRAKDKAKDKIKESILEKDQLPKKRPRSNRVSNPKTVSHP